MERRLHKEHVVECQEVTGWAGVPDQMHMQGIDRGSGAASDLMVSWSCDLGQVLQPSTFSFFFFKMRHGELCSRCL